MPTGGSLLRSKAAGFALYVLVMLACVFGAARTDNLALKIVAFTVLGACVVGRLALRFRSARQQRRHSTPEVQDLLDLPFLKYYPWFATLSLVTLLIFAAVTNSSALRIVLLGFCAVEVVTIPFVLREIRKLSERQPR